MTIATARAQRCMVTDPTGTPLNVRRFDGKIIGALHNGEIVRVLRTGADPKGKPWPMSRIKQMARAGSTESLSAGIEAVPRRFQRQSPIQRGQAGAADRTGSPCAKGLKVEAIRKAPIPIAQEPT
jgi:hypothetical protein